MYKLTLILLAFLSLISAIPQPELDNLKIDGRKTWITGEVRVVYFYASHYASCRPFDLQATWYHTGLGNCGKINYDHQLVVAISKETYNKGIHCEKVQ
jgi:hypothetical protein